MKVWQWVTGTVAAVAVASVAGVGFAVQHERDSLTHAQPFRVEEAQPFPLISASPQPVDLAALKAELARQADNEVLGTLHVRVSKADTGEVVFEKNASVPLRPASTTKVLTAAAAVLELDQNKVLTTEVVRDGDAVTIRAAGDVWLTPEKIDELAEGIKQSGPVTAVYVDTSVWPEQKTMPGWDPDDIDGGYITPMEPIMIHGGRLGGAESGDEPRSHTPALDVANALAQRLGAKTVDYGAAAGDAQVVASVQSPPLYERLQDMMKDSDNVMAEAIAREIAASKGNAGANPQATMDILKAAGFDLNGVTLKDSCGLSDKNLIPPRLLDDILLRATESDDLRPLLTTLAVAGGDGTLLTRYGGLPGKGWVRAKTGTLTGTSALAGTVTSKEGNVYTFAAISNDSEIEAARAALDRFASTLRDY